MRTAGSMSCVVIITGGIGSGKSLVSSILASNGIPVYDCDSRVKGLYQIHPELKELVTDDLFTNSGSLEKLENSLFPVLMEDFEIWKSGFPNAVAVGFESATVLDKAYFENFGDYIVYVDAPKDIRLQRAKSRGTITEEDILRRMALQKDHSNDKRVNRVINNDSTLQETEIQIIDLIKEIKEHGKRKN